MSVPDLFVWFCCLRILDSSSLCAIVGGIFKLFWVTCPKWISSCLYIGMGWLCVLAFSDILRTIPKIGFGFLLAGGIVYTIGDIIYALKLDLFNNKHPYLRSHEIFHLFVMGGTLLQFVTIYLIY